MALYEVTGPDGKVYEVEGPAGASDAQVIAAVRQQIEADRRASEFMATRDAGFFENILTGLGAGAVGTLESAALGLATPLDEREELATREVIKDVANYLRPEAGNPEDLSYQLASGVGSLGAFLGTALLGPAALPAAGALAVGSGAGEASERARAAGISEEERNLSTLKGAGVGATEILPLGRFISKFGVPAVTDMVNKLGPKTVEKFRDRVRNAAITGGIEGAQEATAAVLQNAIEQGYNPDQTLLEGAAAEGGIGAFAGALLGLFLPGKPRDAGATQAKDDANKVIDDAVANEAATTPPTEEVGNISQEDIAAITEEDLAAVAGEPTQPATTAVTEEPAQPTTTPETDAFEYFLAQMQGQEGAPQASTNQQDAFETFLAGMQELRDAPQELPAAPVVEPTVEPTPEKAVEEQAVEEQEPTKLNLVETAKKAAEKIKKKSAEKATKKSEQTPPAVAPAQEVVEDVQPSETQPAPAGGSVEPITPSVPEQRAVTVGSDTGAPAGVGRDGLGISQPDATVVDVRAGSQPSALAEKPKKPKKPKFPERAPGEPIPPREVAERLAYDRALVAYERALETYNRPAQVAQQDRITQAVEQSKEARRYTEAVAAAKTKKVAEVQKAEEAAAIERIREDLQTERGISATTEQVRTAIDTIAERRKAPTSTTPKTTEKKLPKYEETLGRPLDTTVDDLRLSSTDVSKIKKLPVFDPESKKAVDAEIAAGIYLLRYKRPADAIQAIAFDIANDVAGYTTTKNKLVDAHFAGTGAKNAKQAKTWIDENLSSAAKKRLEAQIIEEKAYTKSADNLFKKYLKEKKELVEAEQQAVLDVLLRKDRKAAKDEAEVALTRKNIEALDEFSATATDAKKQTGLKAAIDADAFIAVPPSEMSAVERNKLRASVSSDVEAFLKAGGSIQVSLVQDAVVGMTSKVHPAVSEMIKQGDIQGALYALGKTGYGRQIRNAATKMADKIGSTKVVVEKNLKNSKGDTVAGLFDPETNTIKLNSDFAGNIHTILHESAHAVTSATLANKAHPLTRQLQNLFDSVKDQLSTHYGAQSLDEFVAEIYTNPEFRAELSRVYPKESNTSALRKAFNYIVNFFRKLFGAEVQPKLTNDNLNAMIETIMAPAPDMRNAGSLYMVASEGTAGQYTSNMARRYRSVSEAMKKIPESEFMGSTKEFFTGTAPKIAKQALAAVLPSQALADQTQRLANTRKAYRLHEMFEELEGATNRSDNKLDAVASELRNWIKANPELKDTFNSVVYTSTLEGVDPSKPKSNYKGDKATKWEELQVDWEALESQGQEQYVQLRDSYATMYDKLIESIETSLGNQAKKVFLNIFPKQRVDPYFPLVRKGDYWVKYNDPNGEFTFEAFETKSARDRHIAQLKAAGATNIDTVNDISKAKFNDVPSASFVGQVIQLMQANNVQSDVIDSTMRLFVQMLPATSFAKSLQKRQGTAGFNQDALFAFQEKAYSLGRQIVSFKYSKDIRNTMEELRTDIIKEYNRSDSKLTDDTTKVLINDWNSRTEFAVNPPTDFWARATRTANRIAFLGTIGFNISSAVVNFSQVPLVVLPYLAGRTSFKEAQTNLYTAMKLFNGSGFSHRIPLMGSNKTTKVKGMPSLDNYYQADQDGVLSIRTDIDIDDKGDFYKGMTKRQVVESMLPLVQKAADRGLLNRSLFYDTLGAETSGKSKNLWDRVSAWSAFSFHTVERHNRQVSLVANFLNELTRLETRPNKAKGELNLTPAEKQQMAVENALYETQQTNGGSVLATSPRIAQKHIGRMAMMYKTYGIQMYYTQTKTFFEMLKSEPDPEVRRIARRQFIGTTLSTLALSGVHGLTLFGIAAALYNLWAPDDEEDAETLAREYLGEGLYKGVVNQLTGVDVAARIGLSNLILQTNRYNFDPSMEKTIVSTLGGPFYGYGSQVLRGFSDIVDGEVQRGVENILPSAFRNMAKTFRYVDEGGINTRRGDPIFDDMTFGLLTAQFLGFAPAEYTRNQERNQVLKRIDRTANENRTKLLRKYYIASRMGDTQGVRDTEQEIAEFNRKHPTAVITPETIKRSMAQHMKTSATMYNGVTLSPNMRAKLEEIGRGFE